MKAGYTVRGKVEGNGVGDPVNKGQVPGKRGLDLDIIDENGVELNSERVISEGYAYKARFGFRNEAGEEVILFEGVGASKDRYPKKGGPEQGKHAGKVIPLPGYTEVDCGISAVLDSNGLRMLPNFKHQEDGIYTAFGSVDGVEARFPGGNTIGFGKAAARKGKAKAKGHK